jgi:hypothetical protein
MVEAGFNTESQKQLQFAQLMQLQELLGPGVLPAKTLIDAATLQDKQKLIDDIEAQQQQQQQAQQAQQQSEMAEQQARIQLSQARAVADQGLGLERVSRVEENHELAVERRAKAKSDESQAILDLAKAMHELEGIDIEHMHKLVSIMQMMAKATEPEKPTALKSST